MGVNITSIYTDTGTETANRARERAEGCPSSVDRWTLGSRHRLVTYPLPCPVDVYRDRDGPATLSKGIRKGGSGRSVPPNRAVSPERLPSGSVCAYTGQLYSSSVQGESYQRSVA